MSGNGIGRAVRLAEGVRDVSGRGLVGGQRISILASLGRPELVDVAPDNVMRSHERFVPAEERIQLCKQRNSATYTYTRQRYPSHKPPNGHQTKSGKRHFFRKLFWKPFFFLFHTVLFLRRNDEEHVDTRIATQ